MVGNEKLVTYNEDFTKSRIEDRVVVHKNGMLHEVVHCWFVERSASNLWIYLQQRSLKKENYPGLYDITAAGHIDILETPHNAVQRETLEELGIILDTKYLKYVGTIREKMIESNINNNEICNIYFYMPKEFLFNLGSEVEKMVKVNLKEFRKLVEGKEDYFEVLSLGDQQSELICTTEVCKHERKYFKYVLECLEELYV